MVAIGFSLEKDMADMELNIGTEAVQADERGFPSLTLEARSHK